MCIRQYHNNCKEQGAAYEKQKTKTEFTFKLICNIRTRTNKAFKSQIFQKTNRKMIQ